MFPILQLLALEVVLKVHPPVLLVMYRDEQSVYPVTHGA
jgi:hypothetical protein